MPDLATATQISCGSSPATEVWLGGTKVWPVVTMGFEIEFTLSGGFSINSDFDYIAGIENTDAVVYHLDNTGLTTEIFRRNIEGLVSCSLSPGFNSSSGKLLIISRYISGGGYRQRVDCYNNDNNNFSTPVLIRDEIVGVLAMATNYSGDVLVVADASDAKIYKFENDAWGLKQTLNFRATRISIDSSGNTIVLADPAYYVPFAGSSAGRCFIYELSGSQWQQTALFQGVDWFDNLGITASITPDGSQVAVGAKHVSSANNSTTGSFIATKKLLANGSYSWSKTASFRDGVITYSRGIVSLNSPFFAIGIAMSRQRYIENSTEYYNPYICNVYEYSGNWTKISGDIPFTHNDQSVPAIKINESGDRLAIYKNYPTAETLFYKKT
jgi:hypothetical protein